MTEHMEATEEVFTPNPDDWFDGTLLLVTPTFWFAELTNGERCFIPGRYITDPPVGHKCSVYIKPGMKVALRIRATPGEPSPYKALEAVLDEKLKLPTHEEGEVVRWDDRGFFGYIQRRCGCHIFAKIVDRFPLNLFKGDRVRFRIVNTAKGWAGEDVELIEDSRFTEENK